MGKITNLLVLAAVIYAAWYGYSHLIADSPTAGAPAQSSGFNCRQALAKLAEETACRSAASCTMSDDEIAEMKQREKDVEKNCN